MLQKICGWIPHHLSNRLVLGAFELLRRLQRRLKRDYTGNRSRNEQNFARHRAAIGQSGGYIEDQSRYADMAYGKTTMRYAGCEIFAVYNAMRCLAGKAPPLPEIISAFEQDGMVLAGRFGTAPKAMADYLDRQGFVTKLTTAEDAFDAVGKTADGLILTFYNDKDDIRRQVHTVFLSRENGALWAHNVYGDGRVLGPCGSVPDLLRKINGGRAKGIALIAIDRKTDHENFGGVNMRKIIFMDVDGTLVNYDGKIPDSAIEAIRKARANGHRVYICTGRSEAEVYQNIWDIGIDGMIGGNGSYVKDGSEVVLWKHITLEECKQIVDWLHGRGLEFYLEANSGLYASERFEEVGEPVMQEYAGRKGKDGSGMTVRDAFPEMIFGEHNLYRDDLNKVSFILNSYQDYLDAVEAFPEMKVGTWGGVGETALFGDIGVKEIDKGYAIDVLLEHLQASASDTIAFGDAKIDILMLEKCAIGVAVGNGGEEIKRMADYITDSVENDGIYKAFVKFGLI
jgi:hypothetical protein